MKASDYINLCADKDKSNGGTGSDYALSKKLEIAHSAISRYRNKSGTFDNMVCFKVADYLGVNPLQLIAEMEEQRAKGNNKSFWNKIVKKLEAAQQYILCKIEDVYKSQFCCA